MLFYSMLKFQCILLKFNFFTCRIDNYFELLNIII